MLQAPNSKHRYSEVLPMTSPKVCLDLEVTSGANIFCLVSITDPPAGKLAREKVGGGGFPWMLNHVRNVLTQFTRGFEQNSVNQHFQFRAMQNAARGSPHLASPSPQANLRRPPFIYFLVGQQKELQDVCNFKHGSLVAPQTGIYISAQFCAKQANK